LNLFFPKGEAGKALWPWGLLGACAWLLGALSCGLGLNKCVVVCLQGAKEAYNGPRCSVMNAQGLEDGEPAQVWLTDTYIWFRFVLIG